MRALLLMCLLLAQTIDVALADAASADLAGLYCQTIHRLPADLRAGCCGSHAPDLTEVCTQQVDAALADGAIALDKPAIEACAKAIRQTFKGCDWVGPQPPALPAACHALLNGTRKVGAACESSQACGEGLYCRGMGSAAGGVCAEPVAVDQRCEITSDPLTSFAVLGEDTRHPTCSGHCARGRCLALAAEGATCDAATFCAAGLSCQDKVCTKAPSPQLGEACGTQRICAEGLRCIDERCAAPLKEGASCGNGFECHSLVCDKPDGATQGHCASACANPTLGSARFVLPK